ncbi:MAG: type II secretion system protein [Tissierellales bacterium]|nr:type II secretion system protein [Tissierellales bacterium]
MIKKGFVLIEILIGIAILGLVSVTSFNLLKISFTNNDLVESRTKIIYLCQNIVEELKSDSIENELIFDEVVNLGSYVYTNDDIKNEYVCEIKFNKLDRKLLFYTCTLKSITNPKLEVSFECSRFIK